MRTRKLIAEARQGGLGGLESLLQHIEERKGHFLYKKLRALGVQDHDLSHAVQDVLMEFTKSFRRFNGESEGELVIFLGRICSTVARLYRRWDRNQVVIQARQSALEADWLHPPQGNDSQISTKDEIKKALRELSKQERDILILHDFYGHSYKDIADQLQCRVKTVENTLQRARKKMRASLLLNAILADILIKPSPPILGQLTEIGILLHNVGHQDATQLGVEVNVESHKLGQNTVDVPRQSRLKVDGFAPWFSRPGEHFVNVTLSIAGQEHEKNFTTEIGV